MSVMTAKALLRQPLHLGSLTSVLLARRGAVPRDLRAIAPDFFFCQAETRVARFTFLHRGESLTMLTSRRSPATVASPAAGLLHFS